MLGEFSDAGDINENQKQYEERYWIGWGRQTSRPVLEKHSHLWKMAKARTRPRRCIEKRWNSNNFYHITRDGEYGHYIFCVALQFLFPPPAFGHAWLKVWDVDLYRPSLKTTRFSALDPISAKIRTSCDGKFCLTETPDLVYLPVSIYYWVLGSFSPFQRKTVALPFPRSAPRAFGTKEKI